MIRDKELNTKFTIAHPSITIAAHRHTMHTHDARSTNRKIWRPPSEAPHPAQQTARRCRPRVTAPIRLQASSWYASCMKHDLDWMSQVPDGREARRRYVSHAEGKSREG
jgi:hypothetical protein